MNTLSPQELANLWYLKFEHKWVARDELPQDWKDIGRTLMQHSLADYEMISVSNQRASVEIIKLKESYK